MKILLINPSSHTKYPSPPLGLLQLASCVQEHGHEVRVIDLNLAGELKNIRQCDIIGITAVTPNINEAIEVSKNIKSLYPETPIILGGPHATILPEETLEAGAFDMVLVGEADKTLPMLFDSLEQELPLDDIPNLYCKAGDYIWDNKTDSVPIDMNELPMPDYSLINLSQYHPHPPYGRKKPWLPMITSRGCPSGCAFCSKPVFGSKYRAINAADVVTQLGILKETYGVKEITFYDDVFTIDFHRTYDICDGILQNKLDIDWSCETRVNLIGHSAILPDMKRAGCFLIAYGIESGSLDILANLNKGISLEQVEQAIAYTREAGIQTIGYFMIGSPGEALADIDKTINFAIKLKLDYAQFAITTPLPGSQLYQQYLADGHQMPNWDAFSYANMGKATIPMFNSQNLTTEDIKQALSEANKRFYLRLGYMWQRGLVALKSWDDFKLLAKGAKVYLENMIGG